MAATGDFDPDHVTPIHGHRNPVSGAAVVSSSWPCPQCVALGLPEPMQYRRDVPDDGGYQEPVAGEDASAARCR